MWVLYNDKGLPIAYTYNGETAKKSYNRYGWMGYYFALESPACEVIEHLAKIDDETGRVYGRA